MKWSKSNCVDCHYQLSLENCEWAYHILSATGGRHHELVWGRPLEVARGGGTDQYVRVENVDLKVGVPRCFGMIGCGIWNSFPLSR